MPFWSAPHRMRGDVLFLAMAFAIVAGVGGGARWRWVDWFYGLCVAAPACAAAILFFYAWLPKRPATIFLGLLMSLLWIYVAFVRGTAWMSS